MLWRLALLVLVGAVLAWNPRPQTAEPPRAAAQEAPAVAVTEQQARDRSAQCARTSQEVFSRDWKDAGTGAAHAPAAAEFVHHYNARLDTCFYLVTVNGAQTQIRKLFDVNERELYGEYLGPGVDEAPMKAPPAECRVAGLYCASGREWEVLVRYFLEG